MGRHGVVRVGSATSTHSGSYPRLAISGPASKPTTGQTTASTSPRRTARPRTRHRVPRRLERFGRNSIPGDPDQDSGPARGRQFHHPLIAVLLVAGVVTACCAPWTCNGDAVVYRERVFTRHRQPTSDCTPRPSAPSQPHTV